MQSCVLEYYKLFVEYVTFLIVAMAHPGCAPSLFLLKKVVICRDFLGNLLSIFFRAFPFLLFLLVFLCSLVE